MKKNGKTLWSIMAVLALFLGLILCMNSAAAAGLTITEPSDGEVASWDDIVIEWDSVSGAAGYRISVRNLQTNELVVDFAWTTSTRYKLYNYVEEEYASYRVWVGAMSSKSDEASDAIGHNQLEFVLSHEPEISNGGCSGITSSSAVLEMELLKNFGYAVTDSGFYVGTSSTKSSMTKYSFKNSGEYDVGTKEVKRMTITGLAADTTYYYRAYAVNRLGEEYTAASSFTTKVSSLAKAVITSPDDTKTYSGGKSIKLAWDPVTGAEGYRYYVKRLKGMPDRTNTDEPSIETWSGSKSTSNRYFTLNASDVVPGYWYKFVVEAYADGLSSSWSKWIYCYVEDTPLGRAVISSPKAWGTATAGQSIDVSWSDADGADGYNLYIKQLTGEPDTANTNETSVNSWTIKNLDDSEYILAASRVKAGYWYKFVVEAYADGKSSTWSPWVYVYVPEPAKLEKPTILSPEANNNYESGQEIRFTWSQVDHATGYDYYIKELKGEPDYTENETATNSWSGSTGTTGRQYILKGASVKADTWYKFVVMARAEGYQSSWSGYTYIRIPDREDWIYGVLPGGAETISAEAFLGNIKLRTFDASGTGLKTIGSKAFSGCTNLVGIYLPDTVESIADDAFEGCSSLVIHCMTGSYAEKYAKKKNITVEAHGVSIESDVIRLSENDWVIPTIDAESKAVAVSVNGSGAWTASSSASWITLSSKSGTGSSNVVVSAGKNTGSNPRTATVTFTCGNATAVLTVKQNAQAAKECSMKISEDYWEPSSSELSREFFVQGATNFSVSSDSSWLTYTKMNGTVTAKVTSASLSSAKTGILKITCNECGASRTITVQTKGTVVPAPTGVYVETVDTYQLRIRWNPVEGATYTIERSTSETSGFSQIGTAKAGASSYTDTKELSQNTTYYYRVYAIKSVSGTEKKSAAGKAYGTTAAIAALSYTGEFGSITNQDTVLLSRLSTLSWSTISSAKTYKVKIRDLDSGVLSGWDSKDVGKVSSVDLTGVFSSGARYRIWIGAYNSNSHLIAQTSPLEFTVQSKITAPTIKINSVSPASVDNSGKYYFGISFTAENASSFSFSFNGMQVEEKWDKDDAPVKKGFKSTWDFDGESDISSDNGYSYIQTTWTAKFYPKSGQTAGQYSFTVTAHGDGGNKSASGSVTIKSVISVTVNANDTLAQKFETLKKALPNSTDTQKYYWNHHTSTDGNLLENTVTVRIKGVDGKTMETWRSTAECPSPHHSWENYEDGSFTKYRFSISTCNAFSMQSSGIGEAQCIGFANTLAWAISGKNPISTSWSYTAINKIEDLSPGDIVWINTSSKYGHKFMVLRIDKEKGKVYTAECNWGSRCMIQWDYERSFSNIKSKFYAIKTYARYSK